MSQEDEALDRILADMEKIAPDTLAAKSVEPQDRGIRIFGVSEGDIRVVLAWPVTQILMAEVK